nr:ankyrin repeat-containing protein At5g02620-like [Quercus suber]
MDPSGSFGADKASGQSSQTKDNSGMEPVYYNAAAKIEIGVLKDIPKPLDQLLTPNRNTVLHIHLTSPIKISEDSISESSEPAQAEVNIGMKADYYNGAANGKIGVFKNIPEPLDQLLTPNRNTVLHIYLTSLKESESKDSKSKDSELSTAFVEEILKMCPPLLQQANAKGETPLHIAARYGHAAIADVLIKRARERAPQEDLENGVNNAVQKMLEMTNNEKDTALHEAVRGNHLNVVERLIEEGKDFSYSQNEAGETPLYIAVERGFKKMAFHILETCTSPAHDGPLGRTTLHAAVINAAVINCSNNDEMFHKILERIARQERSALIKKFDKQRQTPLHYAAYYNKYRIARDLMDVDISIAYMKDAKGMTALHIAAHQGHGWVMDEILEYCPDCCELVDKRGWNALHFVVNSSSSNWAKNGAKGILGNSSFSNLLNEKDAGGDTPFHHHSKSLHYIKDLMCHDRVDKMTFNKQNLNAYDVALTSEELSDKKFMQITRELFNGKCLRAECRRPLEDDILSKRKDYVDEKGRLKARKSRKDRFVSSMKEASQYHLVVDTLIATVAFTAGITMPGGFRDHDGPHPGSAVLTGNAAFKAFAITNTIAMVQSCSAAFIHLFMPLLFHDKNLIGDFSFLLASLAFCLSISAMGAMMLAFVTGTYAVLMHSLNLAIANSVIGLCFFIPLFFDQQLCEQGLDPFCYLLLVCSCY